MRATPLTRSGAAGLIDAELALGFVRTRARVSSGEPRQIGILVDRILIVEKGDHRGVLLHRGQEIDESALEIRADCFVLECPGYTEHRALDLFHQPSARIAGGGGEIPWSRA
jgi:hypothetical protein